MTQGVTVIIPSYNRLALVRRAVDSAIRAAASNDQIVVVDDGSSDSTLSELRSYGSRIQVLAMPHRGAGAARNAGLAVARHDLIAFLDSDDEWDADKLALQRTLLEARPDLAYTFSDFRVIEPSGKTHPRYLRTWMSDPRPWSKLVGPARRLAQLGGQAAGSRAEDIDVYLGDFHAILLESFCISTITVMVRKSLCQPARFADDVATYEDYQFFGEITRGRLGAYLDAETATNHGHALPRLTGASEMQKLSALLRITERVWGSDPAFLERHGRAYLARWQALRRARHSAEVRACMLSGDLQQARSLAPPADELPWKLRTLLALPNPIARVALSAYRSVRIFRNPSVELP